MKLARLIRHRGPDGGGVHIYEAAKKEVSFCWVSWPCSILSGGLRFRIVRFFFRDFPPHVLILLMAYRAPLFATMPSHMSVWLSVSGPNIHPWATFVPPCIHSALAHYFGCI